MTDAEKERAKELSQKRMRDVMRKVDKEMRKMEISLEVELGNNNLALTDRTVGNHKLVDFGYCG